MFKRGCLLLIILIVLGGFGFAANQYPYVDNPFSASFHKPLNETSGTTASDTINTTYTGTLVNMEGDEFKPMKIGNGVFISGEDEYINTKMPISSGSQAYTFCLWLNMSASQPHSAHYFIGAQQDGTSGLAIYTGDNSTIRIRMKGGGTGDDMTDWVNGWGVLVSDVPVHFCLRKDTRMNVYAFSLFINGANVTLVAQTVNDITEQPQYPLFVGVTSGGDIDADTRMMADEIIFFNRTLTNSQIETLFLTNYTAGAPPVDEEAPNYTNFQNNASTVSGKNSVVNWSVTLDDNEALSWYIFGHNETGTWQNVSFIPLSTKPVDVVESVTITKPRGTHICGKFTFNDTTNNTNQTLLGDDACFTVANTPPSIDNLLPADEDHDWRNLSANFTYTDTDNDLGECKFYINGSLEDTQSGVSSGTLFFFNKNFTADTGHYAWNITCNDGYDSVSWERLFVIDRIDPIIEFTNPAEDNTTISNLDLTLDVSCTDQYLYRLWVNVSNSSGLIYSNAYETETETVLTADDFIDLSSEGEYTVAITCSDQHTASLIPNYGVEKDSENKKLSYATGDNEISVSLKNADVNLDSFSTQKFLDRYSFTYDFSSAGKTERTFVFVLEAVEPLTYLKDSPYKAHFISGTNWIDFNLGDSSAKYTITKINDNKYEISISTTETKLDFHSIGGLNIVEKHASYTFDISSPTWSDNIINDSTPNMNDWIEYSVFWQDENTLDYAWLRHNLSGGSLVTSDLTYINNQTYNFVVEKQVTSGPGTQFCLRTYANDTAGNEDSSDLDCYTVENNPPTVNSVDATSPKGLGEDVTITVNVTDPDGQQYISLVKVGVTPPGETETNYTMSNIGVDSWSYDFTDYENGTYSYTVYAIDSGGLQDSSSGTFDMYANLTLTIFPMKFTYSGNELVGITDPPGLWETKTETNFNDGTYSNTEWNVDHVELYSGNSSGTYTSKIFDAGGIAGWDSIAWSSGIYQQELSDNKGSDAGADMSNNVLLLHMNNNWGDSSGENNNGTANGGVTFSTSSKFGSHAGSFDGDGDYVSTATANFPTGNNDISVEAWFKIDDLDSDNNILTYGNSAGHQAIQLFHRTSDDKLIFHYWGAYGQVSAPLSDTDWHHVTAVHTDNTNYLYLDGFLVGSTGYSNANIIAEFNHIGKVAGYPSYDFDGLIDELAVYDRELSSDEVLEHYKRGALKLNLTVRSCDDASCSGESFTDVEDVSPQTLSEVNNSYFQYKYEFTTENVSYSPELYNVTVSYTLEEVPENQSKLRNDLNLDTSIFLLMKVQYWNDAWVDVADRYFSVTPMQVQPGEANQIKLDQYWVNWSTFDKIDYGKHRVYAAAVDEANQTVSNFDGSLVEAYHNFTVVNTAPEAPELLFPTDEDAFGVLPEFNWSNSADVDADTLTYSIEIDDDSDFSSVTYSNSSIPEDASGISWVYPTLPIRYTYFWRVKANDGNLDSDWSTVRNFTYAVWNVTFNVTGSVEGAPELSNVIIGLCNYTGFNQAGDTSNMYGPYEFPPGNFQCTFEKKPLYFNKTVTFMANSDKIVDVTMPEEGGATFQEHTWLEALYNCIILEDCSLWDILREINQTTAYIWQHVQPTDQSVLTTETISEVVDATHNITYEATVNIPIKTGYNLGAFLPIRIAYWFIDKDNASKCFSQGSPPDGIELIEPYCQPLMVQTMGPMGGSVNFRVDLRPNLTAGTYNVTRRIEIDPNEIWIPYGHEDIGQVEATEDSLTNPTVSVEDESYVNPDKDKETIIIREGSGGGGGSSRSGMISGSESSDEDSEGGSDSPTVINNYYIDNATYILGNSDSEEQILNEKSGLSGITGAMISNVKTNLPTLGLTSIIVIIIVLTMLGIHPWRKKKLPSVELHYNNKKTNDKQNTNFSNVMSDDHWDFIGLEKEGKKGEGKG